MIAQPIDPSSVEISISLSEEAVSSQNDERVSVNEPLISMFAAKLPIKELTVFESLQQRKQHLRCLKHELMESTKSPSNNSSFRESPFKKGILEKKHPRFPTWSKRNVLLFSNKLFYYELDNNTQAQGVLDFNLISCVIKVKRQDQKVFKIVAFKADRVFYFRCTTEQEAKEWVKAINEQIVTSKGYQHNLTRVAIQPSFWKFDRITQKELLETASTGDIVLFRTYGAMPVLQRVITWSRIDHIGLVTRFGNRDLFLLESLGKRGVDFYRWTNFTRLRWNADYEQMIYRKLHCSRPLEVMTDLEQFIKTILGKKHTMSICKLCKCKNVKEEPEKKKGYFCSELIASVFKRMKVIADTKLSSRFYPGTFEASSKSLEFINGAYLDEEKLIDFYLD